MNSEAAVHQKPLTQLPDSFDSPVIYGVRVETSNPYYLLISKHYIQNGLSSDKGTISVITLKVKPKIERFTHFLHQKIVQFQQYKYHIPRGEENRKTLRKKLDNWRHFFYDES